LKNDVNVASKSKKQKKLYYKILKVNDEYSRIWIKDPDPDPLVRGMDLEDPDQDPPQNVMDPQHQGCGSVLIFYGSGSGSRA
jgi:hypothetical protein